MKFTFRIWLLISIVFLSLLSIFVTFEPFGITFLQEGVVVTSVNPDSEIFEGGLRQDMVIQFVNGKPVRTLADYADAMEQYSLLGENDTARLSLQVYNGPEIVGLYDYLIINDIRVSEIASTKLKTGLDLSGGARAFVQVTEPISSADADDLISVLEQRLNVYGLTDLNMYKVTTTTGQPLIGVEIAGSTPDELESLIGEQGNFVAQIGNDTVFVGGDKDITYVGRTGTDATITECFVVSGGEACNFAFTIHLSPESAQRHADITNALGTENNCLAQSDPNCYLDEQLDFYIDDVITSSLNIGGSLQGNVATQIQISGSGSGSTREEAVDNAQSEMKRLQTILITGSLPYDLEIVKIDRISSQLGSGFVDQIILAGIFAILSITLFTFLRYRNIKISLAIILVSISETIIILGVAALIQWNLNLVSIAGIIAAIGTGIDSQIIILDESRNSSESLRDRIKKALFIITTAFATTLVALLPLTGMLGFLGIGAASAGLLKGFAITTLIGITVGVVISRPAFADIAKQFQK
jgi:preprotein translocase subunit SecD